MKIKFKLFILLFALNLSYTNGFLSCYKCDDIQLKINRTSPNCQEICPKMYEGEVEPACRILNQKFENGTKSVIRSCIPSSKFLDLNLCRHHKVNGTLAVECFCYDNLCNEVSPENSSSGKFLPNYLISILVGYFILH